VRIVAGAAVVHNSDSINSDSSNSDRSNSDSSNIDCSNRDSTTVVLSSDSSIRQPMRCS
jgi:hypothetical protein